MTERSERNQRSRPGEGMRLIGISGDQFLEDEPAIEAPAVAERPALPPVQPVPGPAAGGNGQPQPPEPPTGYQQPPQPYPPQGQPLPYQPGYQAPYYPHPGQPALPPGYPPQYPPQYPQAPPVYVFFGPGGYPPAAYPGYPTGYPPAPTAPPALPEQPTRQPPSEPAAETPAAVDTNTTVFKRIKSEEEPTIGQTSATTALPRTAPASGLTASRVIKPKSNANIVLKTGKQLLGRFDKLSRRRRISAAAAFLAVVTVISVQPIRDALTGEASTVRSALRAHHIDTAVAKNTPAPIPSEATFYYPSDRSHPEITDLKMSGIASYIIDLNHIAQDPVKKTNSIGITFQINQKNFEAVYGKGAKAPTLESYTAAMLNASNNPDLGKFCDDMANVAQAGIANAQVEMMLGSGKDASQLANSDNAYKVEPIGTLKHDSSRFTTYVMFPDGTNIKSCQRVK